VQDQPNDLDGRVRRLDDSVDRLRTEVTSLKLELATLVSAIREFQRQSPRVQPIRRAPAAASTHKPSLIPAAAVVLIAAGLLSWQVALTPRGQRQASASPIAAAQPAHGADVPAAPTIAEAKATEPPPTPLVRPTIYRGTLTVSADHPDAEVFVNRMPVGKAPVRVRNLRAGAHLVWVESDGYRRWTRVITVPAERVTRVTADLEPVADAR
jgi:hypothetical protein